MNLLNSVYKNFNTNSTITRQVVDQVGKFGTNSVRVWDNNNRAVVVGALVAIVAVVILIALRFLGNLRAKNSEQKIENWDRYLAENFDVSINCNQLENAQVIFLGDDHSVESQSLLRRNVIRYYANEAGKGENLILIEGLDCEDTPKEVANKKLNIESWEKEEHYEQALNYVKERISLQQEMDKKCQERGKCVGDKQKTKNFLSELNKLETSLDQQEENHKKIGKLRNEDLINKVQASIKNNLKIFVIAGSAHLKDISQNHDISDSFKNINHAVLIPKSEKNAADKEYFSQLKQEWVEKGTYNYPNHRDF